ncbi:unnamed protein product [Nippostrongylus brasiliensis]|uniref:Uncharacterized protein n=1 Tax=Nippostrongylus brasiliensis TaxID=27835 RepID=A0A0N4YR66_NIPBR|nr:unnamed protein product [Nippostrongylus brasiliensis]
MSTTARRLWLVGASMKSRLMKVVEPRSGRRERPLRQRNMGEGMRKGMQATAAFWNDRRLWSPDGEAE